MTPAMIRLRSLWFQVHKWLGLSLAILVIPISLSGAALVWHDWIGRQIYPQRYPTEGTLALPPSDFAASAMRLAEPGERVSALAFPEQAGAVQATLTKQLPGGVRPSRAIIWLNPRTAEPIDRGGPRDGILGILHVVHGSLMVPALGPLIVGWTGVAMLVSSLTGIWLWWPTKGSVARGLRWRRRADFNSNLHHTAGFWVALPLAVLSATGVWISFPSVFNPASRSPSGPVLPLAAPRLSPDQALAAALPLVPGKPVTIAWPTQKEAEWTVALNAGDKMLDVNVDDSDASAAIAPPKPETLARTMRRIHDGTEMPVPWQVVIFLGGILPAALAVTGILMWLRIRRHRERHRRSTAAMEAAADLTN